MITICLDFRAKLFWTCIMHACSSNTAGHAIVRTGYETISSHICTTCESRTTRVEGELLFLRGRFPLKSICTGSGSYNTVIVSSHTCPRARRMIFFARALSPWLQYHQHVPSPEVVGMSITMVSITCIRGKLQGSCLQV